MNRLRWPGFAARLIVSSVSSSKIMFMRFAMDVVIGSVTFASNTMRNPYTCQTHGVCTFLAELRVEGDSKMRDHNLSH